MKVVRRLRSDQSCRQALPVFVAACAVSALVLGLSLEHVSAQSPVSKKIGGAKVTGVVNGRVVPPAGAIRIGVRVSEMRGFPVLPPIFVDYRDDNILARAASRRSALISLGSGESGSQSGFVGHSPDGVSVSGWGESCRKDAECDDCNPCTLDACGTHACSFGGREGFSCDPDNNDCGGKCIGGVNTACPDGTCDFDLNTCVGGSNHGLTCTPVACFSDAGCCGDAGVGGAIFDGVCLLFPCDELTPPAGGGSQCINALIPEGLFLQGSECDDGLFCNGSETCSSGACIAGTDFCSPGSHTVCHEDDDACLPFCVDDGECDLDGDSCSNDVCRAKTCVGGYRDGLPCRFDDAVSYGCIEPGGDDGTCTGGGDGACVVEVGFCGPGAGQCTPGFCIDTTPGSVNSTGQACTDDDECGAGACGCPRGRCCVPGSGCAAVTFAACETLGGAWLATDDACDVLGQSDVLNACPAYCVGIAPAGTPTTAVGPILSINPQGCANTLFSAGDDYDTGAGGYIAVEIVRFIASVQIQSRLTIEFWDTSQSPPILIEDTFFAGSPGTGGPMIRTLVFDPPLVAPDVGVMALVNADHSTPWGAASLVAVKEAPLVGASDPEKMWLNGQIVTGGVLGVCNGGPRNGQWCDLTTVLADCPGVGATCDDIPDTLAFEIVGSSVADPSGACCDSPTGACILKLPWVCRDEGGMFQGEGTFCRACRNDPFESCTTDADCPACVGDPSTEGDPCGDDFDCGNGSCTGMSTCTPVPPACSVQSCCAGQAIGTIPVCNSWSDNAGFYCPNGDIDCDGGLFAACDDTALVAEGNCVTIRGGCSKLVDGISIPCSRDSDCPVPGDTCLNNDCPTGTGTGAGNFGLSCAPNVCVQPQFSYCPGGVCSSDICVGGARDGLACIKQSGGDNCVDVSVAEAPVPTLQSPSITITTTLTGNNAGATYDDYFAGLCNGGVRDTLGCDPNAADQALECPGGQCDSLCGSGIFNPDGTTADPGWWEAFHISECANVRIGFCGSSLVVQPAWSFLSTGCPCANFIANEGVDPPIGTGLGGDGNGRGDPFCSLSDNLWQTFHNLTPGTYYYPIHSGPDGTCAAPAANPEAAGCTYQLQITTGACAQAACCAEAECVGGSDAGLPCLSRRCSGGDNHRGICFDNTDCPGVGTCMPGLAACPDGECVNGVCDAGIMIGHPCTAAAVDQCPSGICTAGPVCTQTNALRCDAAGGFFAGELNLPEQTCAAGPRLGNACTDDVDCPESFCTPSASVTKCPPGELGVCEFGACCNGPGECGDPADPLALLNRQQCDAPSGGFGSSFVAGSRCNYPDPPCPVCSAAETPGNCQEDTAGFPWSIDLYGTSVNAGPVADDFIANVSEIGQFCFSPCFAQRNATGELIGECADPQGLVPPPPDQFLVRFLEDGANDLNPDTPPGFPGDPLPGSFTGSDTVEIAAKRWKGPGSRCWDYSIVFDPPITGFVKGERYWVEFSAKGSRDENGDGCEVSMLGSLEGNGWSFYDSDRFGEEALGNRTWDINDAWLWFEGGVPQDFAFCIEGLMIVPPPMIGACCRCDGTCTNDVAPTDCLMGFNIDLDTNVVTSVNSTVGEYFPLQTCDQIDCFNVGAGGCPGELGELGEDCGNPICVGPAGAVCANGGPPDLGLELFESTKINASNLCSSTDGAESYAICGTAAEVPVGNDQWYEVHTPATGALELDLCGSRLDTVLAVYTNGTSTCPNDVNSGGACPPVGDPVICSDDECSTLFGTPGVSLFGEEGQCYLVRVGGNGGAIGTYQIEMNLRPTNCPASSPPVADQVDGEDLKMTRALAFSAGDTNLRQAIRVRIDSVREPRVGFLVGSIWWVQPPQAFGEEQSDPNPRPGEANFLASELGFHPFFWDWHGLCLGGICEGGLNAGTCQSNICIGGPLEGGSCSIDADCPGESCTVSADCGGGIINVFGEMVVPGASYTVSVVGEDCNLEDESTFTDASLTMTTSIFGDILDSGILVVIDSLLAIVGKFTGSPGAMRKMRVDTEPSALDFMINVTDVIQASNAFVGLPYKFLQCDLTEARGLVCFGGPTHQQPCVNDLDCRIPLSP